ncbi:uncharacterized protein LOC131651274 [Vicia villosa]|uniref:uncharacterized protein LOC131651274 n=1 Tax=Vicia villosa TaxID=3911 RepID=UPI00273B5E89|nr:uncharacterized protein LOC131651274 [Vicia villosa]
MIVDGMKEVEIELEDVELEIRYWDTALIMYAIGRNLSMNIVKNYMRKMWSFVALPEMFYNEEGYFIMRFKTETERDEVMMKGPYTIQNMPMVILEWRPDFSMERDMLHTVPIWVTLPQLPLHLWGEKSLGKIGSVIGNPLYTDECTAGKLRVTYARILIEVDVTQKLCEEIVIKDYGGNKRKQAVEYEWRPKYCEKCQKVRHVCNTEKKPIVQVWKPKADNKGNEGEPSRKHNDVISPTNENLQSPVMEVACSESPKGRTEVRYEEKGLWTVVKNGKRDNETIVKSGKADNCRKRLGNNWNVINNYKHHDNGRIWIVWDPKRVNLEEITMTEQMIHCRMYNVRGVQDRIGGKEVKEHEFKDLRDMMEETGLFDIERQGDKFTWFNKHTQDPIYSCIDRVLGNIEWIQQNHNKTVHTMEPGISDHALIYIKDDAVRKKARKCFRFLNAVTSMNGYQEAITKSWHRHVKGSQHKHLWNKLIRLKAVVRGLGKPLIGIKRQIDQCREKLTIAHNDRIE